MPGTVSVPRRPWGKILAGALAALTLLVGGWWSLTHPEAFTGSAGSTAAGSGVAGEVRVGQAAPDFTAQGLDGKPVTLSSLRGKPVWLSFGGSWCPGCRSESPDMQAAYGKHGRDVQFLSVYLEDAAAAKAFTDKLGLTFPGVSDPGREVAAKYPATSVPVHFFIDAQGVVSKVHVGTLSAAQMEEALTGLSKG